ncbi:hypothetical protein G8A07_18430 [Roseateles sp. DAIF2]|uniref:rhodanese-like domain-containing protein n=1 Tax=Roseateles sp. DAIF2 TaxID=2714952 RepID=UPI0018A32577|nr:rhodanese-like domain-containing protein [Roseateles sp. DAIF2]QPF74701.1 hypothetical protein G8A07_18430 [Roseateles sp. DAIF2]
MSLTSWRRILLCGLMSLMAFASRAADGRERLVDVAWLQAHREQVLLLDASSTSAHRAGHIPGAVSVDLYSYGVREPSRAEMAQRIRSWGVGAGRRIVIYDQGGDMMAPRLFYDLYYHGMPAEALAILDGGLHRWRAAGGAVSTEPTPAPAPGDFTPSATPREEQRSRLPEFLAATGDRGRQVLVEGLEPAYHYGAQRFFDRPGHVPHAVLMPGRDFFNEDKTFKSSAEIRRMARHLGVRPEQVVHSHCGGGVAAAVPWFALHVLAGYPQVKLYLESQHEWLRDDRGLPYWTYGEPQLRREAGWVNGWNGAMLRAFDAARLNIVDVREPGAYAQGHPPFALNLPAARLRELLGRPAELAALLGPAGVQPAHEVVLMSDSGVTPDAALAFLAFEQLGQKVSLLTESVDDWGLKGFELTKEPTRVGARRGLRDMAVPAARYEAAPLAERSRPDPLLADARAARGEYPPVFVASGRALPAAAPEGQVLHLPYAELLTAEGQPKTAGELWQRIERAGVPRYAQIVFYADDPAEAAVNYYLFRLMGWPDIRVWLR